MLYLELGKQQKMHISLFYEKANTLFLSWYATSIDFNSNFKKDVNKKGHNLVFCLELYYRIVFPSLRIILAVAKLFDLSKYFFHCWCCYLLSKAFYYIKVVLYVHFVKYYNIYLFGICIYFGKSNENDIWCNTTKTLKGPQKLVE